LSKPLILLDKIYFLKTLAQARMPSIIGDTALEYRVRSSYYK